VIMLMDYMDEDLIQMTSEQLIDEVRRLWQCDGREHHRHI